MQIEQGTVPAGVDDAPELDLWNIFLVVIAGFVIGGGVALLLQLHAIPGISASLEGTEPKAYWYLARSTAFVGFILLWLSMLFGLLITNRLARLWPGGPAAYDLHQYTSLLGLALGCFHALILTGDSYTDFTLRQVLVPFASSNYRPLWVGFGQIAIYLAMLVSATFYLRRWIGKGTWRVIHFASFASFALVLLHGIYSGTDAGARWVQLLYWAAAGSLLALSAYRIGVARRRSAPALRSP